MVLTLNKIPHRVAGRNGLVFIYSAGAQYSKGNVHNLRHSGIKATMIYTHVSNKAINRIKSPMDRLNLEIENKSDEKKSLITLGD